MSLTIERVGGGWVLEDDRCERGQPRNVATTPEAVVEQVRAWLRTRSGGRCDSNPSITVYPGPGSYSLPDLQNRSEDVGS